MTAVILVEPESSDNIGAVARAMKNMGFHDLRLVRPPQGWKQKGKKMAMSAADLLSGGRVFADLKTAVADHQWILGTSRRVGTRRGTFQPFEKAIRKMADKKLKSAVVFGRESKGLSNEELALCHAVTTIPADSAYPSLNLAQAVMVVLFSLARSEKKGVGASHAMPAGRQELSLLPHHEIERTLAHFEKALEALDYQRDRANIRGRILVTLRGLFKRAGLLRPEAEMFKGIARRVTEKTRGSLWRRSH